MKKTAFKTALYSVNQYGGAFLAVQNRFKRNFNGIDPNRHFKNNNYAKNVITILDTFRDKVFPYASLHNNDEGYYGNGGKGTISMFKKSKNILNFPAGKILKGHRLGIQDEDTMVYLVGQTVKKDTVKKLNSKGINVKYELVKKSDGSMSNYVLLNLGTTKYINIETEHGDYKTQVKILNDMVEYFFDKYQ